MPAEFLERHFASCRHADEPGAIVSALAHHHREAGAAGDPGKALRFARAAGDAAMTQLAYDEAAAHYHVALDLLDVAASAGSSAEQRCDLLIALGEAQQPAGPGTHSERCWPPSSWPSSCVTPSASLGRRGSATEASLGTCSASMRSASRCSSVPVEGHFRGRHRAAGHGACGAGRRARVRPRPEAAAAPERRGARAGSPWGRQRARAGAVAAAVHDPQPVHGGRATGGHRRTDPSGRPSRRPEPAAVRTGGGSWRALQAADRPEVDAHVDEACRLAADLGEPFMGCASLMLAANKELLWGDLDELAKLMDRYYELAQLAEAGS